MCFVCVFGFGFYLEGAKQTFRLQRIRTSEQSTDSLTVPQLAEHSSTQLEEDCVLSYFSLMVSAVSRFPSRRSEGERGGRVESL